MLSRYGSRESLDLLGAACGRRRGKRGERVLICDSSTRPRASSVRVASTTSACSFATDLRKGCDLPPEVDPELFRHTGRLGDAGFENGELRPVRLHLRPSIRSPWCHRPPWPAQAHRSRAVAGVPRAPRGGPLPRAGDRERRSRVRVPTRRPTVSPTIPDRVPTRVPSASTESSNPSIRCSSIGSAWSRSLKASRSPRMERTAPLVRASVSSLRFSSLVIVSSLRCSTCFSLPSVGSDLPAVAVAVSRRKSTRSTSASTLPATRFSSPGSAAWGAGAARTSAAFAETASSRAWISANLASALASCFANAWASSDVLLCSPTIRPEVERTTSPEVLDLRRQLGDRLAKKVPGRGADASRAGWRSGDELTDGVELPPQSDELRRGLLGTGADQLLDAPVERRHLATVGGETARRLPDHRGQRVDPLRERVECVGDAVRGGLGFSAHARHQRVSQDRGGRRHLLPQTPQAAGRQ